MNKKIKTFLFLIPCLIFGEGALAQNSGLSLSDSSKDHALQDSAFVYEIPFKTNFKARLIQGYHGFLSHKNEYANDFKVKPGTPICAARSGVVIKVKEDSKERGLKRKFLKKGNYIVVQHNDSTCAGYWHLQFNGAKVSVGDTVKNGEVIGFSGNSGYSAFPHLHFMVFKYVGNKTKTIPVKYKTQRGMCRLRPGRKYFKPAADSIVKDN